MGTAAAWAEVWPGRRTCAAVDDDRSHDDDRRIEFLLEIIERALADLRSGRTGK
jgi:hypothetical protein